MAFWCKVLPIVGIVTATMAPAARPASLIPGDPIPAADLGELDRCRPQRIGEASDCMRRALGERAAAEINTDAGERYRVAFAELITAKWHLGDPESPIARDLRGLHVYDPADAAYVLLADMAARIGRYKLDYARYARERAARGPASEHSPASAPIASKVHPGPLPLDQCRRAGDGPQVQVVTCVLNADRTISRTTSGGTGSAVPDGATAVDLERCHALGDIPAGSHLKACYRLADGRLLRQTARTVPAE